MLRPIFFWSSWIKRYEQLKKMLSIFYTQCTCITIITMNIWLKDSFFLDLNIYRNINSYTILRICLKSAWCIDYIVSRSLTTNRLWSSMLRLVIDNIKLYNVRERRVHITEASPMGFVQNVHCMLWTFWGYRVQPGVSVL